MLQLLSANTDFHLKSEVQTNSKKSCTYFESSEQFYIKRNNAVFTESIIT